MDAIKRTFKFVLGSAFGAAVGAGVAALYAPKSGTALQAETKSLVHEVQAEGEAARIATEESLARRFRVQVDDGSALTPKTEHKAPRTV